MLPLWVWLGKECPVASHKVIRRNVCGFEVGMIVRKPDDFFVQVWLIVEETGRAFVGVQNAIQFVMTASLWLRKS